LLDINGFLFITHTVDEVVYIVRTLNRIQGERELLLVDFCVFVAHVVGCEWCTTDTKGHGTHELSVYLISVDTIAKKALRMHVFVAHVDPVKHFGDVAAYGDFSDSEG